MLDQEIEAKLNELRDLIVQKTVNKICCSHIRGTDSAQSQYKLLEEGYQEMNLAMKKLNVNDEFADQDTQVWMEACDNIMQRNTQRLMLQVDMLLDAYEQSCCDGPVGEDLADLTIKTAQSLAKGIKQIREKHKDFFECSCTDFEEYDSKNTPDEMYPYIE